ncbi:MAG: family 16 glycoside hydrolase, partial [Bacteroidales bacterium]
MKQLSLSLLILMFLFSCTPSGPETKSLFNGVDLTGWHVDVPAKDSNPDTADAFIVRDSMLVSLGDPKGHLITDSVYMNYRLGVEY